MTQRFHYIIITDIVLKFKRVSHFLLGKYIVIYSLFEHFRYSNTPHIHQYWYADFSY